MYEKHDADKGQTLTLTLSYNGEYTVYLYYISYTVYLYSWLLSCLKLNMILIEVLADCCWAEIHFNQDSHPLPNLISICTTPGLRFQCFRLLYDFDVFLRLLGRGLVLVSTRLCLDLLDDPLLTGLGGGVNKGNFDEEYWRRSIIGNFVKHNKNNSVGWQHTRVGNNKTNKAQASRFYSTASHHSSVEGGGGDNNWKSMKQNKIHNRYYWLNIRHIRGLKIAKTYTSGG